MFDDHYIESREKFTDFLFHMGHEWKWWFPLELCNFASKRDWFSLEHRKLVRNGYSQDFTRCNFPLTTSGMSEQLLWNRRKQAVQANKNRFKIEMANSWRIWCPGDNTIFCYFLLFYIRHNSKNQRRPESLVD